MFCDAASGYIHVEHQVTLNASDSIMAKEGFERMALDHGVVVDSYHTDNGIFKSKAYVKHLVDNHQSIRYSGVGAKWQNGVAENGINIVGTKARTMMIHAALMWPEVEDKALWPMTVSYAAHLYNHTPNEKTGIAPIELFSRTTSDGQALRNAHPWGCPLYVLEPRLTTEGGKIPKWQPRSRRGQFVGVSPVHAENIVLARNLTTGYLSPQYHVVFDDWFETVYSSHDDPPPHWEDMCVFQRFEIQFDEEAPPPLAQEWFTPEEIALNKHSQHVQKLRQGRRLYQDGKSRELREDLQFQSSLPSKPPSFHREPPLLLSDGPSLSSWNREATSPSPSTPDRENAVPNTSTSVQPPVTPVQPRRNPTRTTRGQGRDFLNVNPKLKSYAKPSSLIACALACTFGMSPMSAHMMQHQVLGYNPVSGTQEAFHPAILQSPLVLKAQTRKDPDLPTLKESLMGPYAEQFWKAMDKEIASLEGKGTWTVVDRSSVPPGTKTVPGTWVQRIKRLPDGTLNKCNTQPMACS